MKLIMNSKECMADNLTFIINELKKTNINCKDKEFKRCFLNLLNEYLPNISEREKCVLYLRVMMKMGYSISNINI